MTLLPAQHTLLSQARRADEQRLHQLLEQSQDNREVNPRLGLQQALTARRIAYSLGRVPEMGWALLWAATNACRLGRPQLALGMGTAADTLFGSLCHVAGQAGARNLLGVLAHERGDLASAYSHFSEALLLSRQGTDKHFTVNVLGNLAQTAQVLGDIENALRWTLTALTLATEIGADDQRARLLLGSVSLSLSMNLPDQAALHAEEAAELCARLGLDALEVSVLLARSQIAEQSRNPERAADCARQALAAADRLAAPRREVAQAQLQLGRALIQAGSHTAASDVLMQVIQTAQETRNPELEVAASTQYALAQMGHQRWSLAREMLTRASRLAHQTGCRSELVSALLTLAQLEEEAGRPQAALSAFRAYHDLDRELFGERQARLTQALLITHEVEQHRRLSAQLEAANAELTFAANHDALTGAMNRRAFMAALRDQMSRPAGQGGFSLVLFDLDHFKQVNDHFGHGIGDEVLKAVVEVCRRSLRESDLICRWGGEEFAALLPGTALDAAHVVVERLRGHLQSHDWPQLHPALRVSGSFGVGEWTPGEQNVEDLLARVDEALYAAKHTGRNRVVVCRVEHDHALN